MSYLLISEADFKRLEMYQSLQDVQYLISVVYHNMGRVKERDEMAERYMENQAKQKELEAIVVEDELQQIFQVISLAGAAIADQTV